VLSVDCGAAGGGGGGAFGSGAVHCAIAGGAKKICLHGAQDICFHKPQKKIQVDFFFYSARNGTKHFKKGNITFSSFNHDTFRDCVWRSLPLAPEE